MIRKSAAHRFQLDRFVYNVMDDQTNEKFISNL